MSEVISYEGILEKLRNANKGKKVIPQLKSIITGMRTQRQKQLKDLELNKGRECKCWKCGNWIPYHLFYAHDEKYQGDL